MKLAMYVSNDLIDCVPLERGKIILPGYISSLTRMLKKKHYSMIGNCQDEPEFLIHALPDEVNFTR